METSMQKEFATKFCRHFAKDDTIAGIAAAGSWITNELDQYSDLDLIVVTHPKIGGNKEKMLSYAQQIPGFISGFTGEHVGEPRVLICLYESPLLHIDLKFVTLEEFQHRIENPVILLDKEHALTKIIETSTPSYPPLQYQWIEDRFWTWVHYALLKIGRGELMEAFDFLGFLRMQVLGPLLLAKNKQLPRGVRKVEMLLLKDDFKKLETTLPNYNQNSIVNSLQMSVDLYRELRLQLFPAEITYQQEAEKQVMAYWKTLNEKSS